MNNMYMKYENIGDMKSNDIFEAALRNDCKYVIRYYENKSDINIIDKKGENLLHKASKNNNYEIIDLLIKMGVSVNKENIYGDTPLHFAVQFRNDEVVEKLIIEGANVDHKNKRMITPLHIASSINNLNVVNMLLNHGAKINDSDENGLHPIHYAARSGQKHVIRALLDCGSSLLDCDNRKNNVLHFACENGDDDLVMYILRNMLVTDFRNIYGQTAMHIASINCSVKALKALLLSGFRVDIKDNDGQTPYDLALINEKYENANFLLEYLNSPDYRKCFGKYKLHYEVSNDNYQYIYEKVTITNVNDWDYFGRSLMYYALINGNLKIVKLLYERYARIKTVDGFNQSALLIAIYNGNLDIIHFLLEHGANPNEIFYNKSYLYRAILSGNIKLVKILIDYGADIDYIDNKHRTIYSYALEFGNDEILELLLSKYDKK